jgi:cytochrome c oxidase subunit II
MPLTRKTPPRLVSLVLPLAALLLAGCAFYPPDDVTSQGKVTRDLYDIVFILAAAIFLAVEGAIIWIVVRYRRKPTDTELPSQFHGNNLIEVIWTVIPTVIVLYLFVISWQALNTVEAKDPNPAVRVTAQAERFAWSFVYRDANDKPLILGPDGKELLFFGTMQVPPGAPVHVTLFSKDVIHAFYVPKFLFKRDVVPNQKNEFDFTVDPGDAGQNFSGQCAELCGIGHGGMTFQVHAQTSLAAFQTWLQASIACHCEAPIAPDSGGSAPPPPSAPPSGSAPPGSSAPGSPPPSGSPAAGGPAIPIAAANLAYDKSALEAPVNAAFSMVFANNDSAPHNVEILDASGAKVFDGEIVTGPKAVTYQVKPCRPGRTSSAASSTRP